jgi:hypothetical protein
MTTRRAVPSPSRVEPRKCSTVRDAETTIPIPSARATRPPSTANARAVLWAVSMRASRDAATNDPAPDPNSGACVNACHPATQMLIR